MEKIRIIHSRPMVSEALKICLHKINIEQVELSALDCPSQLDDDTLYLVDSFLYKKFIPQEKTTIEFALLVSSDDDSNISEALQAGVVSIINIAKGPAHFTKQVESIKANETDESTQFIRKYLANQNINPGDQPEELYKLTPKEMEILKMMREGKHLKLIAHETDTTYETVRTHVKHIYKKLGVMSASEAVIKAMKIKL